VHVGLGGDSFNCGRKANGSSIAGWVCYRINCRFSSHARRRDLPWSSSASQGTETAIPSRYVLPSNLEDAIRRLDDRQLDRLVSVALEERARRRQPLVAEKSQRKRNSEAVSPPLPQGKLNAVRAAFKAGVTPARIAREFGISQQDVRRALRLAGDAKKQ
jgi:hypothetical protein